MGGKGLRYLMYGTWTLVDQNTTKLRGTNWANGTFPGHFHDGVNMYEMEYLNIA